MFAGFNNSKKRSTISNGDWDRDGVKNKKDCSPFDHKKQDKCAGCGDDFSRYDMIKSDGKMYCPDCSRDKYYDKMSSVRTW